LHANNKDSEKEEIKLEEQPEQGEQLEFEFETYEPAAFRKRFREPKVTIAKDGRVAINAVASEKYLNDYRYAILSYSEKGNVVGIKPSDEKSAKTMSLGKQSRSKARIMVARGFLKYFGLQKDKTHTYPTEWNEQLGMLIVKLDEGEEVVIKKRSKDTPSEQEAEPGGLDIEAFAKMTTEAIS